MSLLTEEEFLKSIRFRRGAEDSTFGRFTERRIAEIGFGASVIVDTGSLRDARERDAHVKETLIEALARKIYEDRRREFCEAIYDLHKHHPLANEYHQQVEKILLMARRQPPQWASELMD